MVMRGTAFCKNNSVRLGVVPCGPARRTRREPTSGTGGSKSERRALVAVAGALSRGVEGWSRGILVCCDCGGWPRLVLLSYRYASFVGDQVIVDILDGPLCPLLARERR